jgi:hypothetical protein
MKIFFCCFEIGFDHFICKSAFFIGQNSFFSRFDICQDPTPIRVFSVIILSFTHLECKQNLL